MDSTLLHGIELWTRLGVPESERSKPQRVLVDIELGQPIKDIAVKDDVARGIDYQLVVEEILKLAITERKTLERLTEDIADVILKKFKPEGGIKVTAMKKPDLPLASVSITIQRP